MKVNELLREDLNVKDLIEQNCGPFLAEGAPRLWRGMNLASANVKEIMPGLYEGTVRENRKPADTSADITKAFDDYFKKKTGIKYRTDSLFVSGDRKEAFRYQMDKAKGDTCAIYPIGEFHYAWSDYIRDLYYVFGFAWGPYLPAETLKLFKAGARELGTVDLNNAKNTKGKLNLAKWLFDKHGDDLYHFDEKLAEGAAKDKTEIMISCKKFYAFITDGSKRGRGNSDAAFKQLDDGKGLGSQW